jgi:hypothetical protein
MGLRLFVAAAALFSFAAQARTFNNTEAGAVSFVSGVAQGVLATKAGLTWASKTKLASIGTKYYIFSDAVPEKLTQAKMDQLLADVEKSWFPRRGFGQYGGAEIEIAFDQGAVNRLNGVDSARAVEEKMAEGVAKPANVTNLTSNSVATAVDAAEKAKPEMVDKVMKIRMLGSQEDLAAKLAVIRDSGGVVSKLGFRSMVKGPGLRTVSGIFMVYFGFTSAANNYRAAAFGSRWAATTTSSAIVDDCKGTDQDCRPGVGGALWNSADAVFYAFYADN